MTPELYRRLEQLELTLPPPPKPVGSYVPVLVEGNAAYLSGQISKNSQGKLITGKVGKDLTLEQGKDAARAAVLNALSALEAALGLDRVERVLRLVGYVQTSPEFYAIPDVVNGASDLLLELFGEQGRHARSAVGVASLPLNAAVEIEITVKVKS